MLKGITAGAFDICHAGHLIMFEECKKNCDWLVVALHINPQTERDNKNHPVQTSFERYMQLKACKFIDEIIPYDTEEDLYNLLVSVKPDVRFMGNDWQGKPNYSRDKLPDMRIVYNDRKHSFSSTNLRERIRNAK